MHTRVWTEEQFEGMSWHDNHVHAIRLESGEYGSGILELDLDYILEWNEASDGKFEFRIVPALLTFREVVSLRVGLDYATPTAAMGPFSIHAIERRTEVRPRYEATIWRITINWPVGNIEFEASGYEQRSIGPSRVVARQWLFPHERSHVPSE